MKVKNGNYSIVDIVRALLTKSVDPTAHWRKLKQRLKAEGNETVTYCHGLKIKAQDDWLVGSNRLMVKCLTASDFFWKNE